MGEQVQPWLRRELDEAAGHSAGCSVPVSASSVEHPKSLAGVPPLPRRPGFEAPQHVSTPSKSDAARRLTSAERYNMSNTPEATGMSPWWSSDEVLATRAACSGLAERSRDRSRPLPAQIVAALRPFVGQLRQEILQEVREVHYAQLEQNFQLMEAMRQDLEALRGEVAVLRGELRVM